MKKIRGFKEVSSGEGIRVQMCPGLPPMGLLLGQVGPKISSPRWPAPPADPFGCAPGVAWLRCRDHYHEFITGPPHFFLTFKRRSRRPPPAAGSVSRTSDPSPLTRRPLGMALKGRTRDCCLSRGNHRSTTAHGRPAVPDSRAPGELHGPRTHNLRRRRKGLKVSGLSLR